MPPKEKILEKALEMAVLEIQNLGCCAFCFLSYECPGHNEINSEQCERKIINYLIREAKESLCKKN